MTVCKTGAEHIQSLKDGRTVYIDGKLVPDVTEHPAFKNSVRSAASLYDFQAKPENIEFMTFKPDGANRRVNRAWQMPKNHAEMVQRRKAMQAWAELSAGDGVATTIGGGSGRTGAGAVTTGTTTAVRGGSGARGAGASVCLGASCGC